MAERGAKNNSIREEKSLVTVAVAVGAVGDIRHTKCGGTTNRVHPIRPAPASDAHGIAQDSTVTLLQMVGHTYNYLNPHSEQCASILVLDCALCHIAEE